MSTENKTDSQTTSDPAVASSDLLGVVNRAIDAMRVTQRLFQLSEGHVLMTACKALTEAADKLEQKEDCDPSQPTPKSEKDSSHSPDRLVMRRVMSSYYKNSMTGRHMLVCRLECGHSQTVKYRNPAPNKLGCVECTIA